MNTSKRIATKAKKKRLSPMSPIEKPAIIDIGPPKMLNGQNLNHGAKNPEPYTDDFTLEYDVCLPHTSGGLFISMSCRMNQDKPSGIWQCFDCNVSCTQA